MKCDEVQLLQGPFLDSELDARTTLEIEQHLKSCAGCARLFAEEQKLEARMKAGLNRGPRTPALWERIERKVVAAAAPGARPGVPESRSQPGAWQSIWSAFGQQLQAGWSRSRWAWSGLAGAWMMILVLNLAGRQAEGPRLTEKQLPQSSEMRQAVKQKQLWMTDLAVLAEPAPVKKARVVPASPRSDRRRETLNT